MAIPVTKLPTLLPQNYIYISHLSDTGDADSQFWQLPCNPDTISDTMQSNFAQNTALGRSAPVFTYQNSGPRTVQVSLTLRRDALTDVNLGISNVDLLLGEDYMDKLIKALQSIAVPKYIADSKVIEPPLVALRLSNEVFVKGVVTGSIGIEYALPILTDGKYAQVTLTLQITEVDPYDADMIYKNGSFRGMVKTLDKMGLNSI